MSSIRSSLFRCLPLAALVASATFAGGARAAQPAPAASSMCQSIQNWVASDARTTSGASADDVASELLGARFTQVFGKDYSQLTVADFRVLRGTQGLLSCERTGVLQAGQAQIASTLLNPNYQTRWIRDGAGKSTLGGTTTATTTTTATPLNPALTAPAAPTATSGTALNNSRPIQAAQTTSAAPPKTTGTPASNQTLKGMRTDAKNNVTNSASTSVGTAVTAGTSAVTTGFSNLVAKITGPSQAAPAPAAVPAPAPAAAPACPSAADMEVIRRTGSKPPAGC